ncbi:MAG TPA: Stp1/IreP family PP2C-type Ser/Thr phosphatase [Longimicrobiales bacterium]|nr:Stp1/IreP family PP2C-type Ser/Thr phosphatase [Longimicrobiales bacterium]
MPISYASRTDRGRVREQNEDAVLQRPRRSLFAVADGMGGHAAGDVASRIAVDVMDERTLTATPDVDGAALADAIRAAHEAILRAAAADPALEGMGTTLTALSVAGSERCHIAHVGDSRAYRLRDGELRQLTRDQTWVQDQVDAGNLTAEQARTHPYSAMLTCALGIDTTDLDVQVLEPDCQPGDVFLLCSDGLTGGVTDAEIQRILTDHTGLNPAADALVEAANDAGGVDNITVALVRIEAAEA